MISLFSYAVPRQTDSEADKLFRLGAVNEIALLDEVIFKGIDFYFFKFIELASEMESVLTSKLLEELMNFKLKGLVNDYRIHTESSHSFSLNDESGFFAATQAISTDLSMYHEMLSSIDAHINDYKAHMVALQSSTGENLLIEALTTASSMLESPENRKVGAKDASEYLSQKMLEIDQINENFNDLLTDSNKDNIPERVCPFGIKEIDENTGGLYTTHLVTIEGPPSYGKTTVALLNPVYSALMAGKNVCYYSIEQSSRTLQNMLLSRFLVDMYGPDHIISPSDIRDQIYLQDEGLKAKIELARYALFEDENSQYGKFIAPSSEQLFTNTIKLEVKRAEIKNRVKFDIVVIDYMYDLEHKQIGREIINLADRMKEGYKAAKNLARFENKCVIVLNQLTDAGVEAVYQGKLVIPGQVAGGHASTRYTDAEYIIGGTEADRANGLITIQNLKMREDKRLPRLAYRFNPIIGTLNSVTS